MSDKKIETVKATSLMNWNLGNKKLEKGKPCEVPARQADEFSRRGFITVKDKAAAK